MAHAAACKPHFLLLPVPEQGHIAPMLSLASRLAALGCTITFVKAEKAPSRSTQTALQELSENGANAPTPAAAMQEGRSTSDVQSLLRFRTLQRVAGGVSSQPIDPASSLYNILRHTLAGLEERQGMVEKMVEEWQASENPITCIVCDFLLCGWVLRVAKRQAIAAAVLVPYAAINFYVPYLSTIGKREEGQELYQHIGLMENTTATLRSEEQKKRGSDMWSWLSQLYEGLDKASHILLNSFKQLEPSIAEAMATSKLNMQFIGPCLPAWEDGDAMSTMANDMAKQAGSLHTEELACLTWLDRQEKGSVLLVSFGSEAILEEEQVQELAKGIEASGCGYLWVVRADAPLHNLPPKDFRDRTRDMGMCAPWVPQRKVLQHSSTGGFLTHCGWNSTLESIVYGVPMLCFPMNADQFFNAHLIQKHWKVGLSLGTKRSVVVSRVEVERAVRTLMVNDELHERATQYQEMAQCALMESQKALDSFVQDITVNKKSLS